MNQAVLPNHPRMCTWGSYGRHREVHLLEHGSQLPLRREEIVVRPAGNANQPEVELLKMQTKRASAKRKLADTGNNRGPSCRDPDRSVRVLHDFEF